MKLSKKQRVVHDYLRDLIATGMKEGDLLPTVSEISATLDISPMTVSVALDKASKLELVSKKQGKGTFVGKQFKNPKFAKIAGKTCKKTVAFVSPFCFDDMFMNDFSLGFVEEINHDHFSLINKHVMMPFMKEEVVIEETSRQADGMVLISHLAPKTMTLLSKLRKNGYPIVFMDHHPGDVDCVSVCVDNEEGVEQIMKHLYGLGHRLIMHLTVDNHYSSTVTRVKTYENFMHKHGLVPQTVIHKKDATFFSELVSGPNAPTAIFAQNDGIAIQAYQCLKSIGLSVPEDVSLAGFDDDDGMAQFEVPLTTYAQPKRRIGAKCARIIQDMLYGEEIAARHYLISGELMVRDSTADVKEKMNEVRVS